MTCNKIASHIKRVLTFVVVHDGGYNGTSFDVILMGYRHDKWVNTEINQWRLRKEKWKQRVG